MDSSDINKIDCNVVRLCDNKESSYIFIKLNNNKDCWRIKTLSIEERKHKVKANIVKKCELDNYGRYTYVYKTNKRLDDTYKLSAKLKRNNKENTYAKLRVLSRDTSGDANSLKLKVGDIYTLNKLNIINMGVDEFDTNIKELENGDIQYKIVYKILLNRNSDIDVNVMNDTKNITDWFNSIKIIDKRPITKIVLNGKISEKTIKYWNSLNGTKYNAKSIQDCLLNKVSLKINFENSVFYI